MAENSRIHPRPTKEMIARRFRNGEERLLTEPHFQVVVQQLVYGVDPVKIIDGLLSVNEDQRQFIEQLTSSTPPKYVIELTPAQIASLLSNTINKP